VKRRPISSSRRSIRRTVSNTGTIVFVQVRAAARATRNRLLTIVARTATIKRCGVVSRIPGRERHEHRADPRLRAA